jgi:ubiquinone/menaquinone biosynthesis C-methylase UbiE
MESMTDHKQVYQNEALPYERLVNREDAGGNLLPALVSICPFSDMDVVETGAGTGRLTCLLAPLVHSIRAFDLSPHMLSVTEGKLAQSGLTNWKLGVADHRCLPVPDHSADIALSGWSICYLVDWNREHWQSEVDQAVEELKRIVKPGGWIILIETLGTGFETPHPPDHLLSYFEWLEKAGFFRTWIRTDYCFSNPEEAVELTEFFFGSDLAETLCSENRSVLPECTGLWRLQV